MARSKYEIKCQKELEALGYRVDNKAGMSRWSNNRDFFNLFDLVAVSPDKKKIHWISIKGRQGIKEEHRKEIEDFKMKKDISPRVKLTLWSKNGKVVYYPYSIRMNRLYARARHGLYARIDIKVQYGIAKDNFGNNTMFENSGTYENPKEAVEALRAFLQ